MSLLPGHNLSEASTPTNRRCGSCLAGKFRFTETNLNQTLAHLPTPYTVNYDLTLINLLLRQIPLRKMTLKRPPGGLSDGSSAAWRLMRHAQQAKARHLAKTGNNKALDQKVGCATVSGAVTRPTAAPTQLL